jgi:RNAse (barnase) inhibitor barstar
MPLPLIFMISFFTIISVLNKQDYSNTKSIKNEFMTHFNINDSYYNNLALKYSMNSTNINNINLLVDLLKNKYNTNNYSEILLHI